MSFPVRRVPFVAKEEKFTRNVLPFVRLEVENGIYYRLRISSFGGSDSFKGRVSWAGQYCVVGFCS
jgi:hypothetical protein